MVKNKQKKMEQGKSRAQSLVEFAITLPLLLFLFSGMIEFGFALNYYLSLLDATREAARYWSNFDPFDPVTHADNLSFYSSTADMVVANLDPWVANHSYRGRRITLDAAADDVLVTVFGWSNDPAVGLMRYPTSGTYSIYHHGTSRFADDAAITSKFPAGSPNAGLLLVEVHYSYHQILGLPWLRPFLPDPLILRAYTIMPLSSAEPTPSP